MQCFDIIVFMVVLMLMSLVKSSLSPFTPK